MTTRALRPSLSASLFGPVCLLAVSLLAGCGGSSNSGGGGTTPPVVVPPTVTSISPTSVAAGAATTPVTVTGTGFTSTTAIQLGSLVETTAYVSSTQVTATVPAGQLTEGAVLPVIALNGSSTSASGAAVDFTVNNPAPTITQFVPAKVFTGTPGATIAVSGTGFVPTTTIDVGGTTRTTTYVNSTQVNVSLTTADLAMAGTLSLTAMNPTPGGGTSTAASLVVTNPEPLVQSLSPSVAIAGTTTATTVTITGLQFLSSSVAQVNGANRATTFISPTQLGFQLTVADQAASTYLMITVQNPTPGGGVSFPLNLTVAAPTPTPTITQVLPNQFIAGSGASSIQVLGTNITPNQTIEWNGSPLQTSYTFGSYGIFLSAGVPANLLATVGTASVTINSPASTPALSNAVTVTISNPPVPTVTSIYPASGPINTATPLSVTGTGFTSASMVSVNGTTAPTTFVSSTELTATISASSVALPGNENITVTTPAPGGGTSTALPYTAYIGLVNNSVVYNPVNGLFYASVPSSAGAPYGNSIVSIDPETGRARNADSGWLRAQ